MRYSTSRVELRQQWPWVAGLAAPGRRPLWGTKTRSYDKAERPVSVQLADPFIEHMGSRNRSAFRGVVRVPAAGSAHREEAVERHRRRQFVAGTGSRQRHAGTACGTAGLVPTLGLALMVDKPVFTFVVRSGYEAKLGPTVPTSLCL